MDVIHKVFVSSTYTDLRLERAAVERTLLHLKCFPIGMEIFPAANDSAWDFIKQQIDDSDYYVLIIAARYGSVHPETGKSYTEMEFDYASERNIPILAFIHEDPGRIHDKNRDAEPERKALLEAFRHKVQSKKLCKYWKSVEELEARVATTITSAKDMYRREGFVRASLAVDHKKMTVLLEQNAELEKKYQQVKSEDRKTRFAHGGKSVTLSFIIYNFNEKVRSSVAAIPGVSDIKNTDFDLYFSMRSTWSEVLAATGIRLMQGCPDYFFKMSIGILAAIHLLEPSQEDQNAIGSDSLANQTLVQADENSQNTVEIQFRALGWISSRPINTNNGSTRELHFTDAGMLEYAEIAALPIST